MGRELKRVPLDFDWPVHKVWRGYLNPHNTAVQCEHCQGTGSSPFARHLKDQWYGNAAFKPEDRGSVPFQPTDEIVRRLAERNVTHSPGFYGFGEAAVAREAERLARHFNGSWSHHLNAADVAALVAGNRLFDFTRTWAPETGWVPKDPPYVPSPQEVNEWSLSGLGHDSCNQWIVVGAECDRLGQETTCSHCKGEGSIWPSPEDEARFEAWQLEDPPTGVGFQIWETVSEGSPISPVFATAVELAQHMATTRWGADKGSSVETWLKFIEGPGWALSMVSSSSGVVTGVEALARDD